MFFFTSWGKYIQKDFKRICVMDYMYNTVCVLFEGCVVYLLRRHKLNKVCDTQETFMKNSKLYHSRYVNQTIPLHALKYIFILST